ncbi:MAG: penicillin-binding protein 2 [Proteobacteria bacterium]|nr:penicillin-binding protein 2 [Pseudomonadota bacterium]MBI3496324.1 penicillin-binding protein 2 [Pseudomonadota bacterium]
MKWNDKEQDRSRLFTRRASLIAGGKLALLATLVGRMYYLQILQSDRYQKLAEDNRINLRLLAPPRGLILDRHGTPIASNQQNYRVVLVAEETADINLSLDALSELIPLAERDRRRILREAKRKRSFVPVLVRDNLSWEEVSRIEVNALKLPGLSIEAGLTRSYPYGETTTHVVGYVAPVSEQELTGDPLLELPELRIGKSGVERFHDLDLRGNAGTSQVEVNALGRVIRELSRDEGKPGRTIGLTLDIGLQNLVMARLAKQESASAVVMSVADGEVLALASHPSYDPAAFARGLTGQEWQDLLNHPRQALNNKAIAGQYPPGSTFKTMTALAALESGLLTPSHRVSCPGHFELGTTRFHCWKHEGHGSLDMLQGICQSCDVYFYDVARRVGMERISAMSRRFGLGSDLGFDLPGVRTGLIPSNEWKRASTGEAWQPGDTVNLGIGQGYITVTPLQLATMAARIASGRAVVPRLTRELIGSDRVAEKVIEEAPDLGISPASLAVIRAGMDAVSNDIVHGTARNKDQRIAEPSMHMAGKTGSAQVKRITQYERDHKLFDQKKWPWKDRHHALFIAFAPVQAPAYCCSVVVEHGMGGASAAAPIARDILLEAQTRDILRRGPVDRLAGASTTKG